MPPLPAPWAMTRGASLVGMMGASVVVLLLLSVFVSQASAGKPTEKVQSSPYRMREFLNHLPPQREEQCSCDQCVAKLRRPTSYHGDEAKPLELSLSVLEENPVEKVLQCVAAGDNATTSTVEEKCGPRFCAQTCIPTLPSSGPSAGNGTAAGSSATAMQWLREAATKLPCAKRRQSSSSGASKPQARALLTRRRSSGVSSTGLSLLQTQTLTSLKTCPVPQPCDCWCHCAQTIFGAPLPPGIPPIPAVNPYQPPPPLPAPVPPPFGGGPPPAGGVPFNPAAPMLLQRVVGSQSRRLQRLSRSKELDFPNRNKAYPSLGRPPCDGPECGPPPGCPESAPCNCYCQCRPPVPSKESYR